MMNFESLTSSEAQRLNEIPLIDREVHFTFTENIDEKQLYKNISKRLIDLETSLEINKGELEIIRLISESFQIASDEKEEVLLRIDWLNRLYKAKAGIKLINNREEAQSLRRLITPVQTCPMKNQLMEQIDSLEHSLPDEEQSSEALSNEELLMEKAIKEAGEVFINLGKAGREHVVREVLNRSRDNASVSQIKELSTILETRVESLKEEKDRQKLAMSLEELPIPSFSRLEGERKEIVINRLIENSKWNGLASLDRMIAQLDKTITIEEEMKNTIFTPDGNAIFILDADKDESGIIQINE